MPRPRGDCLPKFDRGPPACDVAKTFDMMKLAILHQGHETSTDPTIQNARDLRDVLTATARELGYAAEAVFLDDAMAWVQTLRRLQPDLVFNAADLGFFYDITLEPHIAAVLEAMALPFTGSAAHAGILSGDKYSSKLLLDTLGLATPRCYLPAQLLADPAARRAAHYPLIIKSRRGHNSVGMSARSVVRDADSLPAQLAETGVLPTQLLLEEFIDGREVCAGFIGNQPRTILPIFEVPFDALPPGAPRILDFSAKWLPGTAEYDATIPYPAKLPEALTARIEHSVRVIAEQFEMTDYGRIDFRLRPDGRGGWDPCVIDINTNPDISKGAGLANMAAAAGFAYPELIRRVIDAARQRTAGSTRGNRPALGAPADSAAP